MAAARHLSAGAESRSAMAPAEAPAERPDRVYVRLERRGRMRLVLWGMEHGGLRSEVVEPLVPARISAGGRAAVARGIERDLRRGVGLAR